MIEEIVHKFITFSFITKKYFFIMNLKKTKTSYLLIQRVEEYGSLYSLAQTHLVSQDGVGALSPREPQPVQPLQLVGMQGATGGLQVLWLPIKLDGRLENREGIPIRNANYTVTSLTWKVQ